MRAAAATASVRTIARQTCRKGPTTSKTPRPAQGFAPREVACQGRGVGVAVMPGVMLVEGVGANWTENVPVIGLQQLPFPDCVPE